MKNILVTGSLAFDYIMDFPGNFTDHINPEVAHKINVSFRVNKLKKARGGTAGNILYNLILLNTQAFIIGAVGQDFAEYAEFLSKKGVDTTHIKIIPDEFTSQAYIMTDKKDDQISAFYSGAMDYNHTFSIEDLIPLPSFVLITPNDIQAMSKYVKSCKKLRIPYLYDPSQCLTDLSNEQIMEGLKEAKIFINNDYEHAMIKKRLHLSDEDFLKHAEIVIITKGAEGSEIYTKNANISIPTVKPKEVLDPTGAGDAYRSGFMAGFIRNFDLKTCGQMAAVSATYAIEHYGTQNHTFAIAQFKRRYVQAFGEVLELEK